MAQEAAVPLSQIKELIRQEVEAGILRYARSGPLRNASITGGAGLSIREGGSLNVEGGGDVDVAGGKVVARHPDGSWLMLMGGYDGPSQSYYMPDGSPQPMALIWRADGSLALGMYDPDPSDGLQQFLAMFDRAGNVIMSDDAVSGQGLARPYVPGVFHRTRFADFSVSTTSTTFETLWDARILKQHPQLLVGVRASMDTAGTAGELRVMVNGSPLGATAAQSFSVLTNVFGPGPVAGAHMSELEVRVEGRRTGAAGALRVEPLYAYGRQS